MFRNCLFVTMAVLGTSALANAQTSFTYDGTRVSSIRVNNEEILTGGGIYLVGSKSGQDNPTTNFSSVGSNGAAMTNSGPAYKLTFWKKSASTLGFRAEVGPVSGPIATLSLPLDFDKKKVSKFAFGGTRYYLNGSTTGTAYTSGAYVPHSAIPQIYPIYQGASLLGYTGVAITKQATPWGGVDGSVASVRVNVLSSSHYRSMGFFNHFGTNNLELQFGTFGIGEKAVLEGELVVTAKPAPTSWTYQAESHLAHQIGRAEGDGWSVRVGDTVGRYLSYGPYTSAIGTGPRTAKFRLLLDNTTADNNRILTIDVYDSASRRVLASRAITRREFLGGAFRYQDFSLGFTSISGQNLEFRTYWHGGSYARQDLVRVE